MELSTRDPVSLTISHGRQHPAKIREGHLRCRVGNLLVALTKLTAARLTGSSSMFSESTHYFVDTGNEALLLHGYYRSRRTTDRAYPK
ncbi:cation transporter [Bradyrhizobium pachyrhizi]|uniref:cation transporter n=1 Tax=Bradyrhizobium TaxID=374 RepID=UPI0024B0C129|nr:cation transporter [Bradyrhizobium pachyrhizi]WFU58346.1 cation transporter [Bradyrhizobium pachyrhizi]